MISAEFIRRSLELLPVDSMAVIDRFGWDGDHLDAAKAIGWLCGYYDFAIRTLRAALRDEPVPEDDDDEDPDSTPLEDTALLPLEVAAGMTT